LKQEELNRIAKTGPATAFEAINCNSANATPAVVGEGGSHIPQNQMGSNGHAYNPSDSVTR